MYRLYIFLSRQSRDRNMYKRYMDPPSTITYLYPMSLLVPGLVEFYRGPGF